MRQDGSEVHQLTDDERVNWFPHCSPDGQHIAYLSYPLGTERNPPDRAVELRIMNLDGGEAQFGILLGR